MQIERACELHLSGEYACSLTLAGSSESLTHELLVSRDRETNDDWYVKFIRFLQERSSLASPSTSDVLKEKRWGRNSVKHHYYGESEKIEIDLEFD